VLLSRPYSNTALPCGCLFRYKVYDGLSHGRGCADGVKQLHISADNGSAHGGSALLSQNTMKAGVET
jgi:hypothetical protein